MAGEDVCHDLVDGVLIVDLRQPVGRHDLRGAAARGVHLLEHLFRDRAGYGAVIDQHDQLRQRVRRERRVIDRCAGLVQLARQRSHHPVAGRLRVAGAGRDALEVVRQRHGLGQYPGVVLGQMILRDEPAAAGFRQFGQRAANLLDPGCVQRERRKVRLGEIAVVVGFLFRPHHRRPPRGGIEQARFLDERRPLAPRLLVARDLELDGALHVAKRVQVLQLGLDAEGRLPDGAHRDVGVAPQAALFHVPVVHADGHEDLADAAERLGGVGRRPQVGLGDDLDERHAAAVEIQVRPAGGLREAVM
jgi:hypothetical protein